VTDPTGIFREGDQLPLQVIEFDRNQHKIVLSVAAYYKKRERAELDQFLQSHPMKATQSVADAIPEKLKQQAEAAASVKASTIETPTDEPLGMDTPPSEEPPAETPPEPDTLQKPTPETDVQESPKDDTPPAPETASDEKTKPE
jgi:small subunit ribosomal protein S1